MRKHTFQDKKFSAGDANSKAFVDNWDSVFGSNKCERCGEIAAADEMYGTAPHQLCGSCCQDLHDEQQADESAAEHDAAEAARQAAIEAAAEREQCNFDLRETLGVNHDEMPF